MDSIRVPHDVSRHVQRELQRGKAFKKFVSDICEKFERSPEMKGIPAYKRRWISRALVEEPLRRAADFFVLERIERFERKVKNIFGEEIAPEDIRTYALVASVGIYKRRLLSGRYSISVRPVMAEELTHTPKRVALERSFEATVRMDGWELKNTYWEDDAMEYLYRRAVLAGTALFTTILEFERIRTSIDSLLSLFKLRQQGWREPKWKTYLKESGEKHE